jgi:hypothetical protein
MGTTHTHTHTHTHTQTQTHTHTHTSVGITSAAKDYEFLQILDRSDLCGVHMVFKALPEEGVRRR